MTGQKSKRGGKEGFGRKGLPSERTSVSGGRQEFARPENCRMKHKLKPAKSMPCVILGSAGESYIRDGLLAGCGNGKAKDTRRLTVDQASERIVVWT